MSNSRLTIRTIALSLIRNENLILVFEGYDSIKNETFYRPLGGGIEFGETAEEASIREIYEEMNTEIEDVSYLATFQNIFTFNGTPSHEIVLLMSASFKDESYYSRNNFKCNENGASFTAKWINVDEFISGNKILYPDGLVDFLK